MGGGGIPHGLLLSALSLTHNHPDKKTDKQTDRQNPHGQNGRIAPYWKAGYQLTRDHYQLGAENQLDGKSHNVLYLLFSKYFVNICTQLYLSYFHVLVV